MGGSRNRGARRRPSRHTAPGDSQEEVASSARRLLDVSDDTRSSFHASLSAALLELVQDGNDVEQLRAGAGIAALVQTCIPSHTLLRVRLAELAERLTPWLQLHPSEALTIFAELSAACVHTRDMRDTATLAACMRGISRVADTALSNKESRETVERKVPTLIEPIHVALFRPRAMYVTDTLSGGSDGTLSTSMGSALSISEVDAGHHLISDSTSMRSSSQRLAGVRHAAMDALVSLGLVSSRALIPFWSMFLPERDGVACWNSDALQRENLATMMLFEKNTELRSKAVTAATSLIVSSRRFIPNLNTTTRRSSLQQTQAFTSTSSRVVRACIALYTVVASALRRETSAIILAKLAKLASEMCSNVPAPVVPVRKVDTLVRELYKRVVDSQTTDLTTRSAAASAMSVALSNSGKHIAPQVLEEICDGLVKTLNGNDNHPAVEIISVLGAAAQAKPVLFRNIWTNIPTPVLPKDGSSAARCLHFCRLIQTFLMESVTSYSETLATKTELPGEANENISVDIDLAVELSEKFLMHATHVNALQVSAVVSLDHVLKLVEVWGAGLQGENKLLLEKTRAETSSVQLRVVNSIIGRLKELGHVGSTAAVRLTAVRALASTPLSLVNGNFTSEVFRYWHNLILNREAEVMVRGKCMNAFASLLLRSLEAGTWVADEDFTCIESAVSSAISMSRASLPGIDMGGGAYGINTSDRIVVLSAACNMICAFICMSTALNRQELERSSSNVSCRRAVAELMRISRNRGEHLSIRCCACKMLGNVISFDAAGKSSLGQQEVTDVLGCFRDLLDISETVRMRITASRALKHVLCLQLSGAVKLELLLHMVDCFRSVSLPSTNTDTTSKERHQVAALRDEISNLIYQLFSQLDEECYSKLVYSETSSTSADGHADPLMEAVLQHLALPAHVLLHLQPTSSVEVLENQVPNGKMLFESLPSISQTALRRAQSLVEGTANVSG